MSRQDAKIAKRANGFGVGIRDVGETQGRVARLVIPLTVLMLDVRGRHAATSALTASRASGTVVRCAGHWHLPPGVLGWHNLR